MQITSKRISHVLRYGATASVLAALISGCAPMVRGARVDQPAPIAAATTPVPNQLRFVYGYGVTSQLAQAKVCASGVGSQNPKAGAYGVVACRRHVAVSYADLGDSSSQTAGVAPDQATRQRLARIALEELTPSVAISQP